MKQNVTVRINQPREQRHSRKVDDLCPFRGDSGAYCDDPVAFDAHRPADLCVGRIPIEYGAGPEENGRLAFGGAGHSGCPDGEKQDSDA
jgi:hypothetical protein